MLNSPLAQNPWGSLRRTSHTFQRGIPDSYKYEQKIKLRTFPMRTEIQLEKNLGPPSRAAGRALLGVAGAAGRVSSIGGRGGPSSSAGGGVPCPAGNTTLVDPERLALGTTAAGKRRGAVARGAAPAPPRARGSPRAGADPWAQLWAVLRRGSPAGHGSGHFQGTRRSFSAPEAAPAGRQRPEPTRILALLPNRRRFPGCQAGSRRARG